MISPRRLPRPVLILPLVALHACRCDPPPPAPTATSASAAAPVAAPSADVGTSAEADDADVHVLEEGSEPRAVVHFAFVPGRREARVLEIDSQIELHDKPRVHDHVVLRFDLRYPGADAVELTLRGAETTSADIPSIGTTVGATFKQTFGKDGATDPPVTTFPLGADGTAMEYVRGAVVQVSSTLLPRVPPTPIGAGARWRWGNRDAPVYRLESLRDGRMAVETTSAIHGRRRLESGKSVPVNEERTTHIEAPLDGIARHVASTLVADRSSGPKVTTEIHFDSVDKL